MKVLVIAAARSGGFYFIKELSKNHDLKLYHEPMDLSYVDLTEDVVVKVLVHRPFGYDVDRIVEYLGKYDHVFLLDRRDKTDHLRSIYNLYEYVGDMGKRYVWDDSMIIDEERVNHYNRWVEKQTNCIEEVSKRTSIPIIYYEDLYYNTSEIDLRGLKFEPNTDKKLRITKDKKTLI